MAISLSRGYGRESSSFRGSIAFIATSLIRIAAFNARLIVLLIALLSTKARVLTVYVLW